VKTRQPNWPGWYHGQKVACVEEWQNRSLLNRAGMYREEEVNRLKRKALS
jgi:hypothetical protein